MLAPFRKLWDRKVVQWALAYLAGAWGLLEAATLVGEHFGWPGWIHRTLITVALVGLPTTLVLAWYHGEKGQQRVTGPELLMLAALFVVAGSAVALVQDDGAISPPQEPAAEATGGPVDSAAAALSDPASVSRRSIAVLPFENLSAEEANEYFSDGITEDVLTAVAKVGDLHVISRTSSMAYKETDKSVRQIGRELGVGTVLEGSVQREGDRIRITAQLIDARDDRHLWAEQFDRQATDLFAVQSEIAVAIASALEAELSEDERDRILAGGTENLDAYELYLRGRESLRAGGGALETNEEAIAYFQRALELDPDYALAHAGLSVAYTTRQEYRGVAWGDSAILAAVRAINEDPRAAEGYAALARAQGWWGLFDRALENLELALERNPNDADAASEMGSVLHGVGRLDESLTWALRAVSLEPTYAGHYADVGWILFTLGEEEAGLAWLERARRMDPDRPAVYGDLADLYLRRGDVDAAEPYLEQLRSLAPEGAETLRTRADAAIQRGEWRSALDLEERWHELRSLDWEPRDVLGLIQARLGRDSAAAVSLGHAEEMARHWLGRGDQGWWAHQTLAIVHLARGETDRAMQSIERAVERGGLELLYSLPADAIYAPLRDHPRYEPLLDRTRREIRRMREAVGADTIRPPEA